MVRLLRMWMLSPSEKGWKSLNKKYPQQRSKSYFTGLILYKLQWLNLCPKRHQNYVESLRICWDLARFKAETKSLRHAVRHWFPAVWIVPREFTDGLIRPRLRNPSNGIQMSGVLQDKCQNLRYWIYSADIPGEISDCKNINLVRCSVLII